MKNLTNLELSELLCMMSRIIDEGHRFSHVSDKMPKPLKKGIADYYKKLCEEHDRREDLY